MQLISLLIVSLQKFPFTYGGDFLFVSEFSVKWLRALYYTVKLARAKLPAKATGKLIRR